MKYLVSVMFEVEPEEYLGVDSSPNAVIKLIHAMLTGEADLPEAREIKVYRKNPEAE